MNGLHEKPQEIVRTPERMYSYLEHLEAMACQAVTVAKSLDKFLSSKVNKSNWLIYASEIISHSIFRHDNARQDHYNPSPFGC